MLLTRLYRHFSTAAPAVTDTKALLLHLRKQTGYSFSHCKKALQKCDYDTEAALAWLKEEAKAKGWAAASTLGKSAAQGVLGLWRPSPHISALLEVNCRTDFVAKLPEFHSVVAKTLAALPWQSTSVGEKLLLSEDQLHVLSDPDSSSSLGDLTIAAAAKFGEPVMLRRALVWRHPPNSVVGFYAHTVNTPASFQSGSDSIVMGKFVSIAELVSEGDISLDAERSQSIANDIAQHIVGMNPRTIKPDPEEETTPERSDAADSEKEDSEKEGSSRSEIAKEATSHSHRDVEEDSLLRQKYLLDEDRGRTVEKYLDDEGVRVAEFVRFELGENGVKEA